MGCLEPPLSLETATAAAVAAITVIIAVAATVAVAVRVAAVVAATAATREDRRVVSARLRKRDAAAAREDTLVRNSVVCCHNGFATIDLVGMKLDPKVLRCRELTTFHP